MRQETLDLIIDGGWVSAGLGAPRRRADVGVAGENRGAGVHRRARPRRPDVRRKAGPGMEDQPRHHLGRGRQLRRQRRARAAARQYRGGPGPAGRTAVVCGPAGLRR
ncbi:hypothetical protein G6F65_017854 [Rhizopus arrhizus]|nr:hypothetical protein G6F65_017854 [Rhizopus arrhizus]